MTRAGLALRQQWSQEARRAERARDPKLVAQDVAERAAMDFRSRVLERYGEVLKAGVHRGELTWDEAFARAFAAQERTARSLSAKQARIFGR